MHRCDENAGLAERSCTLLVIRTTALRVRHPAPKFACLLHLNKLVETTYPVVADTVRHSCKEVVG